MDNKLRILNYLGKHPQQGFTLHELSKETGIPYATFHRAVGGMEGLITLKRVGKAKVITANNENPVLKSWLIISSEEEKKGFLKKQPLLNKIASKLSTTDIVVLFGSYAKGKQREDSDIDLLIINKRGEKSITFSKYETLFKKRINPMFITKEEFRRMLQDKEENVGKQVLKDHIILKNPEGFWECVFDGKI